jgi:hypothetical protein
MIPRLAVLAVCLLVALGCTKAVSHFHAEQCDEDRTIWVGHVLERMQTIKPGMTRDDLLKVFETQGGIYPHRSFASRDCLYFKVDVEFKHVKTSLPDPQTRITAEDGEDRVVTISRPYLEFWIAD